jgi:hypothetical protein
VNPVLIHTQAPVGFLKGSIRDANASSKNFIDDLISIDHGDESTSSSFGSFQSYVAIEKFF